MSKEELNIEVLIGSRTFGLKVEPQEEAMVQKASQILNERLKELRKTYNPDQKSDFLAMAGLMISVDLVKKSQELEAVHELSKDISSIESRLNERGRK